MKKLSSSVFVILILLNVMGYYTVILGLQYRHAQAMLQQFDEGTYDAALAELMKIPYTDPAGLSAEEFYRVDGDFVRGGEMYRLIKQRLYRDTFHIVYMKDKTGTAINKALTDLVKTFRDESSDSKDLSVIPLLTKEYYTRATSMQRRSAGWEQFVRKETHPRHFIHSFTSSIIHPPERG